MDPRKIDPDGQPCNIAFNRSRREARSIDELLGLCKGVVADGKVVQAEAEFLYEWLRSNWEQRGQWPVNVLEPRLEAMLADGVLDQDESAELLDLLHQLTGVPGQSPDEAFENYSSSLPLDDPAPTLHFNDRVYVFTGKFCTGSRKKCTEITEALGARTNKTMAGYVDYLVVGVLGSRDWIHTSYGRKIEKAVELRNKWQRLKIVSEHHWASHALDVR